MLSMSDQLIGSFQWKRLSSRSPPNAIRVETDFGIFVYLAVEIRRMNDGVRQVFLTGHAVEGYAWDSTRSHAGILVDCLAGITAHLPDPADIDTDTTFTGPDAINQAACLLARICACAPYGFR